MAASLKVWRQIENLTTSIDVYLRAQQLCQISSRSDFNNRALGFFEEGCSNNNNNNNKMSSDIYEISFWSKNHSHYM